MVHQQILSQELTRWGYLVFRFLINKFFTFVCTFSTNAIVITFSQKKEQIRATYVLPLAAVIFLSQKIV